MNRETNNRIILFRGKRVDNGEWVEGNLILPHKNHFIKEVCIQDTTYDGIVLNDTYKVDPATVGQYTGLLDKEGVKIFEGDFVQNCPTKAPPSTHEIKWDEAGWAPFTYGTFDAHDSPRLRIIGNIHDKRSEDTPELLEEQPNEH